MWRGVSAGEGSEHCCAAFQEKAGGASRIWQRGRTARADLAGGWQPWEPDRRVLRSEWAVGKWGRCVQQLLTEVCLGPRWGGDTAGIRLSSGSKRIQAFVTVHVIQMEIEPWVVEGVVQSKEGWGGGGTEKEPM